MADLPISGLPAVTTPLAGTEQVAIVQGGITKQGTVDDLLDIDALTPVPVVAGTDSFIADKAGTEYKYTLTQIADYSNSTVTLQDAFDGGNTISVSGAQSIEITGTAPTTSLLELKDVQARTAMDVQSAATVTYSNYDLTLESAHVAPLPVWGNFGATTLFKWGAEKHAFRAGKSSATEFDDANIGNFSVALGENVIAAAANSFALGCNHNILNTGIKSFAIGDDNIISSESSVAIGTSNTLDDQAEGSIILGNTNTVVAQSSVMIGNTSDINGPANENIIGIGKSITVGATDNSNVIAMGTSPDITNGSNHSFTWSDGVGGVFSVSEPFSFNIHATGINRFETTKTGELSIGAITDGDYVKFTENQMQFFGLTRWIHRRWFGPDNLSQGGVNTATEQILFGNKKVLLFENAKDNDCFLNIGYCVSVDVASNVEFIINWSPDSVNTGNCEWKLDFTKTNPSTSINNAITTYSATSAGSGTIDDNIFSTGFLIPGTEFATPNSIINMRLYRVGTTDTYTGNARLILLTMIELNSKL